MTSRENMQDDANSPTVFSLQHSRLRPMGRYWNRVNTRITMRDTTTCCGEAMAHCRMNDSKSYMLRCERGVGARVWQRREDFLTRRREGAKGKKIRHEYSIPNSSCPSCPSMLKFLPDIGLIGSIRCDPGHLFILHHSYFILSPNRVKSYKLRCDR